MCDRKSWLGRLKIFITFRSISHILMQRKQKLLNLHKFIKNSLFRNKKVCVWYKYFRTSLDLWQCLKTSSWYYYLRKYLLCIRTDQIIWNFMSESKKTMHLNNLLPMVLFPTFKRKEILLNFHIQTIISIFVNDPVVQAGPTDLNFFYNLLAIYRISYNSVWTSSNISEIW